MIIVVHVDGRPTVLSDGVVTRHDMARSNDAGQSSLTLTGVDVSQMMDLIDLSGVPLPMPAEAQVFTLLAPFAVYGVVPMVIPSVLLLCANPIERFASIQGTPYAHISQLADQIGYTFYVEPGPTPGMNIAYWGPDIRTGSPQPALTVDSDADLERRLDVVQLRRHLPHRLRAHRVPEADQGPDPDPRARPHAAVAAARARSCRSRCRTSG